MRYYKIFFSIFVLFVLLVPLYHMDKEEVTEQENRVLAKLPQIKDGRGINSNYGREFESWLGDHFFGRNELISARFQTLYKINGLIENDKAFIGDEGWMFEKSKTINIPSIKKQREKIEMEAKILKKIAKRFEEKDIPIYLVILPEREVLYQKYWKRHYRPKPRLDYEKQMVELLKDNSNIRLILPQKELQEIAQRKLVYYKDDVHLTNLSMSIIIQRIFQKMRDDGLWNEKEVILESKTEMKVHKHVASIAAKLGLPGKQEQNLSTILLRLPNIKSQQVEKKEFPVVWDNGYKGLVLTPYIKSVNNKAPIQRTGIFFGSCYAENVYAALKPLFKTSIKIRPSVSEAGKNAVNFMKSKVDELLDLKKGSTVIIMVAEPGYLSRIKQMVNVF